MPEIFSFAEVQTIIAIKFCLFLFLAMGIAAVFSRWKPFVFLFFSGLFAAIAYGIFSNDLVLMLWGLEGDEVTIAAMYQGFAHGSFFSDFSYAGLPPFYPPLFFWIFSLVGRFFSWNGVQIAKFAASASIFIFPLLVYSFQAWYWGVSKKRKLSKEKTPGQIAWLLAPLLVWIFIDWDAFILKPYEVIAASFSVLWIGFLVRDLLQRRYSWRRFLLYGISGGLIFMTYYLWLVFGAIAIAISAFWTKRGHKLKYYGSLVFIAVVALLIALPYLGPLVSSYAEHGSENWQLGLMTAKGISFYAPMFQYFRWESLLMLVGFGSLVLFWKNKYIRTLLILFVTSYIWQIMGLVTVYFFESPLQEFKGFYFLNRTILAFALAYGIEYYWKLSSQVRHGVRWQKPAMIIGLFFLSTQMFFGFFIDDPKVQERLVESRNLEPELHGLVDYLRHDPKQIERPLTLSAGINELYAFVPMNTFIYFNQHNSHPGALFSERKLAIEDVANSKNIEEFYDLSQYNQFGSIKRLIFYENKEIDVYEVFLTVDGFPNSTEGEVISIPKEFFQAPYFEKVFENKRYVVWDRISGIN